MITLLPGNCLRHAAKTTRSNCIPRLLTLFRLFFWGCFFAGFCMPASGQDTLYYDQHFDPVLDPVTAQFIQVSNCDPQDSVRCVVMTFDVQRGLIAVIKYTNYPEHILHGRCSYWYENGRLCQEANYRYDKKQGPETAFYRNGQIKRKIIWDNDTIVSGSFFLEDGSPKTEVFLEDLNPEEWQQLPAYLGGADSLFYFLARTIKYPEVAMKNYIQGVVVASFVVERSGKISDVRIEESVSPEIDKETIRVIQKMPRWQPGRINGIPIRMRFKLPVRFRLE